MKKLRIVLLVIAVVCIGVAVSYPIRYQLELRKTNTELGELSAMRMRVRQEQGIDAPQPTDGGREPNPEPDTEATAAAAPDSGAAAQAVDGTDDTRTARTPPEQPREGEPAAVPPEADEGEPTAAPPEADEAPTAAAVPAEEPPVETAVPGENPPATAVNPEEQSPVETAVPEEQAPVGTAIPEEPASFETAKPAEQAPDETAIAEENVPVMAANPAEQVLFETAMPTGEPPVTEAPAADGPAAQTLLTEAPAAAAPATDAPSPQPTRTPGIMDLIINDPEMITPSPTPSPTPTPTPTPQPSPTPDRSIRTGALAYAYLDKKNLDESKILPELRDIYELNHDLVGWIYIEDTGIDYPVVQTEDSEFYLTHDFYGENNANGHIILDMNCDPYTPSYNLVISGHHMNSGAMFAKLLQYSKQKFWEEHKIVEFDTLMARKQYVIFAVFYSADYDEDEEGFRYNADIQYKLDADQWLEEIRENQIFDTGIDVGFGDEFITLTTCDRSRRRNGRFVAVARRIREGEKIE